MLVPPGLQGIDILQAEATSCSLSAWGWLMIDTEPGLTKARAGLAWEVVCACDLRKAC